MEVYILVNHRIKKMMGTIADLQVEEGGLFLLVVVAGMTITMSITILVQEDMKMITTMTDMITLLMIQEGRRPVDRPEEDMTDMIVMDMLHPRLVVVAEKDMKSSSNHIS